MGLAEGAMMQVRASLAAEIDSLGRDLGRLDRRTLCMSVDSIRRAAKTYDLTTVALLARACESLLAEGGRGAAIAAHLALMREAVGCEPLGPEAAEAFLAAAAVRLGDGTLLRRH